ncbi:MAG: hypothetical protein CWE10_11560 [Symbiobacterium thermophilum]|uniref:HTH cro/C1-type domain-containing protein n=1 Tax=Symbiobacterium thermophilum TaxID=2734 RepID=A0A953I3H6_SYMTR|nr:hypothetical protein [Symbiobacterium thermophilum]
MEVASSGSEVDGVTFPDRLRRVHERAGFSLREAATKGGGAFTFAYLNKLLRGEHTPTLDMFVILARLYGTTVEYLRDGRVEVDLLAALIRDPQYRALGMVSPHERANGVALLAAITYPGHMRIDDQAAYLGLSEEEYRAQLHGRTPLTDDTLRGLARLTGVPVGWLRVGHWYWILPEDAQADWTAVAQVLAQVAKK